MSNRSVVKKVDESGNGTSGLLKNRYTWAGDRKSDKDGVFYTAVAIERKDAAFTLNILDTVQMEAPDDNCPFVGTVLRLYEINNRKTIDVEWFYLKADMLEHAPKNHKNVAIEAREVFLAEGEVEIVENVLGSVKNPCFIVYLTPQDSLLPANQKAMSKSHFSQLYFCRYSFNQGKGVVNPISPGWAQNKYLLKNWENIPEPIRAFLQKETSLACFKNIPVGEGKVSAVPAVPAVSAVPAPAAWGAGKSTVSTAAGAKSATKAEQSSSTTGKDRDRGRESQGGAQAAGRRRDSSNRLQSEADDASAPGAGERSRRTSSGRASTGQGGSKAAVSADTLSREQILSLDVYDLAQKLMFDDIVFSSSDNQTSSDSDDSAVQRRRRVPGVIRTKGRSSAQKRAQYRKDADFIAHKWSNMSEAQWKEYFVRARTLKDKHSVGKVSSAETSTAAASVTATRNTSSATAAAPAVAPPAPTTAPRPRAASLGSVTSKSVVPTGAVKTESTTISAPAGTSRSATKPTPVPPVLKAAPAAGPVTIYASSSDEDDFHDVNVDDYSALAETFKSTVIRDEELSFQLFCLDEERYGSDTTESESSSDNCKNHGRYKPAKVKTAQQLADRKKRRDDKNFRNWTDVSFKKLKNYTQRARRLRKYHEHVSTGGRPLPGASAAVSTTASKAEASAEALSKPLADVEISDTILQAVRAGLGKYEIAMQLLAVDLAAARGSDSESDAGKRGRKAQDKTSTRRASAPLMSDLGRVEERFNAIPQRRQNEYMKRAGELQAMYGVSNQAYEFSAGASAKYRSKASSDARTTSNLSQGSAPVGSSPVPQRNRPSSVVAQSPAPAPRPRGRPPRVHPATEPRKRPAASVEPSSGEDAEPVRRRRRKSADFELADENALVAPLTRKNFSQARSRYEEVRLKREVAATAVLPASERMFAGEAHRTSTGQFVPGRRQRVPAPAAASDIESASSEKESGDSDSQSGTEEQAEAKPAKLGWRQVKKQREEARRESYKQRTEKLKATIERKREQRTAAENFAQPVHALIPTFSFPQNNGAGDGSDADDASVSSIGSDELQQQTAPKRRGRGRRASVFGPPRRRRHSAPEAAPARPVDATKVSHKRRSDWQEAPAPEAHKRGRSTREERSSAALPADAFLQDTYNFGEVAGTVEGDEPQKRRRGRPRKSGAVPWNFGRPINAPVVPGRSSTSDLPSVASRSVDSASEAGDNSLASGDEVDASHRYGTRGRGRARQNSFSATDFMHQRSPSNRGRTDPRLGENYQVDIPERLVLDEEVPATTTEAVGATTRRSAQSSSSAESAEETSQPMWMPQSGATEEEYHEQARRVGEYLTRAEAVVAQLKADMLQKHFQSEAKLQKQGALLLAQQQRFSHGGQNSAAAVAAADAAAGLLPVQCTDNSLVVLSGEARIVMHQTLMDSEYDVERALAQLPDLLGAHLVLWTSAEQQSLGVAYERFGMHQKSLYAAVPGKPKSDVWEYSLRFLAAAEELEENTTYTTADGVECIIPSTRPTALLERANSHSSSSTSGFGNGASSSSSHQAAEEVAFIAEGNRFIEKLSASVDETSFWQLMLSLSSVIKSGTFTPAQLVVKVHYILSMATYNAALSYAHRALQQKQQTLQATVQAAVQGTAQPNNATSSSGQDPTATPAVDGMVTQDAAMDATPAFTESTGSASSGSGAGTGTGTTVESSTTRSSNGASSDSTSASSSSAAVTPAPAPVPPTPKVAEVAALGPDADVFSDLHEALASFNLFLPVLVSQQ